MSQKRHIMHGRDHCLGGADPIPCLADIPDPTGQDVEDIIMGLGPDAFWKLNETTGTVAADSSGNGHDLQPSATNSPPEWEQEVAPTGDTSAKWVDDTTRLDTNADVAMGAFTDDFSAGVWVKIPVLGGVRELLGQGQGGYHAGAGNGWALAMNGAKAAVFANSTVSVGNNDLDDDTWYFLALVRDAGTWKLYVNGLLQTATQTTSISTGSASTWIGNDGFVAHGSYLLDGLLSYAFIVDAVLTSTELLEIYEAGISGGSVAEGLVWTADGTGSASWEPNLATIAKDGDTPLTGDVTLSAGTNITLTQTGQDIEIAASGGGGGAAPTDTSAWMPLTTVVAGVPELVWDGDDQLIPTLTDL